MKEVNETKSGRSGLLWYLLFSYGFAWLLWVGLGLTALGMFAPLLAVLLTRKVILHQSTGICWKPHFRGNVRYYLLAIFGPAVMTLLGAVVYYLVFPDQFDAGLSLLASAYTAEELAAAGGASALQSAVAGQLAVAVLLGGVLNLPFALGEEAGWRGWLYPELMQRMGAGRAVLVGGVLWGLWHLPLIIAGHNYGTGYAGWPVLGIVAMCCFCICAGICLAWLTVRSGSIWPAALCHGALNAIGTAPQLFLSSDAAPNLLLGPGPSGVLAGIPLILLAMLAGRSLCAHVPDPEKGPRFLKSV